MIRQPRIGREGFPLLLVQADMRRPAVVIRPFRGAVMHRRHEPIVPRRDQRTLGLGRARLGLSPLRGAFERRPDIGHLLHPRADRREIRIRFRPAWRRQIHRSRLVPVNAVGADHIVQRPPLLEIPLRIGLAWLPSQG
jgi:hypothetical protein